MDVLLDAIYIASASGFAGSWGLRSGIEKLPIAAPAPAHVRRWHSVLRYLMICFALAAFWVGRIHISPKQETIPAAFLAGAAAAVFAFLLGRWSARLLRPSGQTHPDLLDT